MHVYKCPVYVNASVNDAYVLHRIKAVGAFNHDADYDVQVSLVLEILNGLLGCPLS
jgi:hypothetical protein